MTNSLENPLNESVWTQIKDWINSIDESRFDNNSDARVAITTQQGTHGKDKHTLTRYDQKINTWDSRVNVVGLPDFDVRLAWSICDKCKETKWKKIIATWGSGNTSYEVKW